MKLKPPHKRHCALPKKRIKVCQPVEDDAPVEPIVMKVHPSNDTPQAWEIVRDILYRMPLCRNDPKEFCPGGKVELVSREIAKALT